MVRALRPANTPSNWKLPTVPEMVPLHVGVVSMPICANKVRNGPASTDQGHSTASQGRCHVHDTLCWNLPTSTYPTFLVVQNLSSKCVWCDLCLGSKPFFDWPRVWGMTLPSCVLSTGVLRSLLLRERMPHLPTNIYEFFCAPINARCIHQYM